jgi:hypothetical protein
MRFLWDSHVFSEIDGMPFVSASSSGDGGRLVYSEGYLPAYIAIWPVNFKGSAVEGVLASMAASKVCAG